MQSLLGGRQFNRISYAEFLHAGEGASALKGFTRAQASAMGLYCPKVCGQAAPMPKILFNIVIIGGALIVLATACRAKPEPSISAT